jgi:putative hydrolase
MFKIDLHTHTVSSGHAYSTLEENVNGAVRNGLSILGISDHASTMPGAPHEFHFLNMKIVPDTINGIKVLKGIEANIIDFNGSIDVTGELLEKMDYVIASLHIPIIDPGALEENTQTLLKVMENDKVIIIGHPDDGRYPTDYERFVLKAKETKTLIEINNASLNPLGSREDTVKNSETILNLCKQYKVPVILSSDAHVSYDVGNFSLCLDLINKVNFPLELIANKDLETLKRLSKIKW